MIDIKKLNEYDDYDDDYREIWMHKKKLSITNSEIKILFDYQDILHQLKVEKLSACLRNKYNSVKINLEKQMTTEVAEILKARVMGQNS